MALVLTGDGASTGFGSLTTTGYIRGPSTFTIDPAGHGDSTGTVRILGGLTVEGTTTTINSTTLTVDDKNIVVASGAVDSAAADGAGLTVDTAGASLIYNNSTADWSFNRNVTIKRIDPDIVLQDMSSSSAIGSSNRVRFRNSSGTYSAQIGNDPDVESGANFSLGTMVNYGINLFTNDSSRMVINNQGNVHIDPNGVTTGLSALSVTNNALTVGSLTANNVAFDHNEIQARLNGAATALIVNKNGGDVGIGTSSPNRKLDVRDSDTEVAFQLYNTNNADTTTQHVRIRMGPDSRGGSNAGIKAIKENADFSTNAGRDVSLQFYTQQNNSEAEAATLRSNGTFIVDKNSGGSNGGGNDYATNAQQDHYGLLVRTPSGVNQQATIGAINTYAGGGYANLNLGDSAGFWHISKRISTNNLSFYWWNRNTATFSEKMWLKGLNDAGSNNVEVEAHGEIIGVIKRVHLKQTSNATSITDAATGYFTWDTQTKIDTDTYTHSTSTNSDNITILKAGLYNIIGNFTFGNATSSARNTVRVRVRVNGTAINSTMSYDYDRGLTYGEFSNNKLNTVLSLSANDVVDVEWYGKNIDGTCTWHGDQSELIIMRIGKSS